MTLPHAAARYFEHLSAGRLDEAAGCFGEDAFYSHPAYDEAPDGTAPRLEGRGREQIRAVFAARGRRDWVHETCADTVGDRFYVDGLVRDSSGQNLLSYLSVGTLDADGLIASYVAYVASPPVLRPEARS